MGRRLPCGTAEGGGSGAVRNTMEIGGYRAIIQFDADIEMFRGRFVGLNGGADFYARDVSGLRREGAASLKVFLEMCEEDGVERDAGTQGGSMCPSRPSCARTSPPPRPPKGRV